MTIPTLDLNHKGPTLEEKWVAYCNRRYWWKLIYHVDVTMDIWEAMDKLYDPNAPVDDFNMNKTQSAFMAFHYEWFHIATSPDQFQRNIESIRERRRLDKLAGQ